MLSGYVSQEAHDTGRSAGNRTVLAEHKATEVVRVEAINVFLRRYCAENLLCVNMIGKRQLNKNAVRPAAQLLD
jgi:hypothetical protein